MKKKYQVFISSTYSDLIEERAAVTQCLLEMDCIPVGMEQFPASNMGQMEYIKMMLDDCDYYILILAGRYGTLDSDGIGFTEKEYNYAIEKGIPVMSFVVKDIGKLINDKCEQTTKGRKKLEAFRNKVCSGKLIKYYTDKKQERAKEVEALGAKIKQKQAEFEVLSNRVLNYDDGLKDLSNQFRLPVAYKRLQRNLGVLTPFEKYEQYMLAA